MRKSIQTLLLPIMLVATSVSYAGPMSLSDLTGVPGFEDYKDQTSWYGAGVSDSDQISDDITFFYLFTEETTNANNNSFGLYNFSVDLNGVVTVGSTLEIFGGAVDAMSVNIFGLSTPTDTTVTFDWSAGTATNNTTGEYFDIEPTFGFYLDTGNGDVLYSDSSLNPSGTDNLLMFEVSDLSLLLGSNLLLAWEDGKGIDDGTGQVLRDFDDMVIGISDVYGVPTPATFALMGLGLLAMRVKSKRTRA